MPDLTRVSTKQILSTLPAISGKLWSTLPYVPDYEKSRIIGGKRALTLPQAANYVKIDRDRLSACLSERKKQKTASKLLALVSYNWASIDSEFRQNTIFDWRRISRISLKIKDIIDNFTGYQYCDSQYTNILSWKLYIYIVIVINWTPTLAGTELRW